jgi:hypothetical protein
MFVFPEFALISKLELHQLLQEAATRKKGGAAVVNISNLTSG